jgi:S-adenosylmethionine:tRNA ribosyltransferase-isomerase
MHLRDFDYELPDELIARHPPERRGASRLLCLDGATVALADRCVRDLEELLRPGDLLVCNNTRVIPARLHARKASGGQVELLIERIIAPQLALAHARASKPLRAGGVLYLADGGRIHLEGREEDLYRLRFEAPVMAVLERCGRIPLPPYLRRPDEEADRARYQTVYARQPGAVAAPTAGLHFDEALLAALQARGVQLGFLTLHVGAGTFQPVRVEQIETHRMHAEQVEVSAQLCRQITQTQAAGGRVVAVGTTVVRALEAAAVNGELAPMIGETRIFIYPGFRFRVVDVLFTNFHLPGSTLLMLVSAFAGREAVLRAYQHAVTQRYRFFSYGDAMLIQPAPGVRA